MPANVVVVNSGDLVAALKQLTAVVKPSRTIPVLECVLVQTVDGFLKLTGTDFETWLSVIVPVAKLDGEVECAVNAARLLKAASGSDRSVEVSLSHDDGALTVKRKNASSCIVTLPAHEFPGFAIEESEATLVANWPASKVARAFAAVSHAQGKQDIRVFLNGTLIDVWDKVRFVATDGHRMAVEQTDLENGAGKHAQFIIPRDAAHAMQTLAETSPGSLFVMGNDRWLKFESKMSTVQTKLLVGKYPDYMRVIAKHEPWVTVGRKEMKEALLSVAYLASKMKRVDLSTENGSMTAKCVADDQSYAEAQIEVKSETVENRTLAFNAEYLTDMLGSIDCENVTLHLGAGGANSEISQLVVEHEGSIRVIMPMR